MANHKAHSLNSYKAMITRDCFLYDFGHYHWSDLYMYNCYWLFILNTVSHTEIEIHFYGITRLTTEL